MSENDAGRCIVAVDVGGTCTDCVVFDGEQTIHFGKALSTPPYFAPGLQPAPWVSVWSNAARAERGKRPIMIEETGAMQAVTVYDFDRMDPGNVVRGPTVIHSPLTTVVVHNGQVARMDGLRNLILEAA